MSQFPSLTPKLLDTFHTPNAGSQLGTEQASVGGFLGETPNSSESSVDGSRRKVPIFEVDSISGDHGLC